MGKQSAKHGLQFAVNAGSGFIMLAHGMNTMRKQR
jgi:hypothetical protein